MSGIAALAGCIGTSDEGTSDEGTSGEGTSDEEGTSSGSILGEINVGDSGANHLEVAVNPDEAGFGTDVGSVAILDEDGETIRSESDVGELVTLSPGNYRGELYVEVRDESDDVIAESDALEYDSDLSLVDVEAEPEIEDREPDDRLESMQMGGWVFSFEIQNDGLIADEITDADIDDDDKPFRVTDSRIDIVDEDENQYTATADTQSTAYTYLEFTEHRYRTIEDGVYESELRLEGEMIDTITADIELVIEGTVEGQGIDPHPEELEVRLQ